MLNFLEENAGNKPTLSVHRKCRSRSPVIKPKLEPAAGLQGAFSALSASRAVKLPGGKIGDLSLLSGRVWDIIEQQALISGWSGATPYSPLSKGCKKVWVAGYLRLVKRFDNGSSKFFRRTPVYSANSSRLLLLKSLSCIFHKKILAGQYSRSDHPFPAARISSSCSL